MKMLIGLSLIACVYAAKLDRAYLPPASAGTAGGSPGSLDAPQGPSGSTGFGQSAFGQNTGSPSFGQQGSSNGGAFGKTSGPAFGQKSAPSGLYGQPGSQGQSLDADFSQPAPGFRGQGAQEIGSQGPQGFRDQSYAGQGNQGSGAQGARDYQRNQPQRAQAAADQAAEILRYDNQNDGETFSYSFETSNGIAAEESGVATNGVQAQGAFSYSDDDGQAYRVTYTADENGYQPQGEHLPTPHPIPEEILKSIEKNAQAAAAGIQEGAYNPDEDNSESGPQQYSSNAPNSYGQSPSGSFNQLGGSPNQLYGAPNAGSATRPQSAQGSQGPSQQYGAPGASSGSKNGQSSPSKLYEAPSNGAGSFANGAQVRPNSFGQIQAQGPSQQYGAPSRPGVSAGSNGFAPSSTVSNGFAPSGPANGFGPSAPSGPSNGFAPSLSQSKPSQYQASSQSAGRPQGFAQNSQAQDDSGYQYDRPQGSSFSQGSNVSPSSQGSTQYRPQNGGTQGSFPRPNSNNEYGSGPQRPLSASGPSASFGAAGAKAPSSFGAAGSAGQGSFGLSSSTNFGPSGSYSAAGTSVPSSRGPSSNGNGGPQGFGNGGSSGYNYDKPGSQSGARPQGQNGFGAPSSRGPSSNGNGRPQGFSGGNGGSSGYNYDRPGSQSGAKPQGQNGFGAPGSAGSEFGGPRQPPSFTEEEGYKY